MYTIDIIESEMDLWDATGASIETLEKAGFYRFVWSVCFKSKDFIEALAKMCTAHIECDDYNYYLFKER